MVVETVVDGTLGVFVAFPIVQQNAQDRIGNIGESHRLCSSLARQLMWQIFPDGVMPNGCDLRSIRTS